jgi:hypothetical protein
MDYWEILANKKIKIGHYFLAGFCSCGRNVRHFYWPKKCDTSEWEPHSCAGNLMHHNTVEVEWLGSGKRGRRILASAREVRRKILHDWKSIIRIFYYTYSSVRSSRLSASASHLNIHSQPLSRLQQLELESIEHKFLSAATSSLNPPIMNGWVAVAVQHSLIWSNLFLSKILQKRFL